MQAHATIIYIFMLKYPFTVALYRTKMKVIIVYLLLFSCAIAKNLLEDVLMGSKTSQIGDAFTNSGSNPINDVIANLYVKGGALADFQEIVQSEINKVLADLNEELNMIKDLFSGKGGGKELLDLLSGGKGVS